MNVDKFFRNKMAQKYMFFLASDKRILELSAVRKASETLLFQMLGIIETLGSIISLGTSKKFADVRTHLRKVFNKFLSSILSSNASFFRL